MDEIPIVVAVADNSSGYADYALPVLEAACMAHGDRLVVIREADVGEVADAEAVLRRFGQEGHGEVLSQVRELMVLRALEKHGGPFVMLDWDELPFVALGRTLGDVLGSNKWLYRGNRVPCIFASTEPLRRFWEWLRSGSTGQLVREDVNEMTLWWTYLEHSGERAAYVNDALAHRLFYDSNVALKEGVLTREEGYKRIMWLEDVPMVCGERDDLIPLAVVHCWGEYKHRMHELAHRAGLL